MIDTNAQPCGCDGDVLCEQHYQALTRAERNAHDAKRRGARGTARGRGAA